MKDDGIFGAYQPANAFGQIPVVVISCGLPMLVGSCSIRFQQLVDAGEKIADVAETAGLLSIAVDGDGFTDECLVEEVGERAAIAEALRMRGP